MYSKANIRSKTIKVFKENVGLNPHDLVLNNFSNTRPKRKKYKFCFNKIKTIAPKRTPLESERTTHKLG